MTTPRRVRIATPSEYGAVVDGAPPITAALAPRRRRFSVARLLGSLLIVAGVGLLGWTLLVWQWQDPFTALYTRWEQRGLASEFDRVLKDEASRPPVVPKGAPPTVARTSVRGEARRFRLGLGEGDPIGRLVVPRLGVDMVVVEGTDSGTLKKGPGRHADTYMPGEGRLVYIAGHRTTYSAPFAHIDRLEPGDRVRLEMPYATVVYSVTRRRIVDDQDLSVLRPGTREEVALQACHPRFFATQRYIVWARPVEVRPRGGAPFAPGA